MTIREVKSELAYWRMRALCRSVNPKANRYMARKILACQRLLRIKENQEARMARGGEGQLLRYRWDELPMPPKGKTA